MRLIYLSPVPWNSFSQRPHELVRYFHGRTGGEVLWIDPYPTRLPTVADVWGKRPSLTKETQSPSWLRVLKPKALPCEPLPLSGRINGLFWQHIVSAASGFVDSSTYLGIGKPCELALQLLSRLKPVATFYDAMDDFPAFYTGWSRISMARREKRIVRGVSTVLVSSTALQHRLRPMASDVRLVLNACASDRLPPARAVVKGDESSVPVIGYIGTIAQWFDWELVTALAQAHPRSAFRLIGPVYRRPPVSLPANIRLEPPLPHHAALEAMTQFDAGLIPFKNTALTVSVDPIKYYEYRALGLPIASSAFGEMALRGEQDGVCLFDRASNMKEVMERTLTMSINETAVTQFRKANSWESRFEQANLFTA